MALLTVAISTLKELARAARSAEKLLDTLNRELPLTLQDIRVTGKELSGLSDEVSGSVQSARHVVEQVDRGLTEAKVHAQTVQVTTRSLMAGATAALRVLAGGKPRRRRRPPTRRPPVQHSPVPQSPAPQPHIAPLSAKSTPKTRPSKTSESSLDAPDVQTTKTTEATENIEKPKAPKEIKN